MEDTVAYVVTGFDEILEWRRITFFKPVPACVICSVCGVVAAKTIILPCCHVLCCEPCADSCDLRGAEPVNEEFTCPVDGRTFCRADFAVRTASRDSSSEDLKVLCPNGECSFSGTIAEVGGHFSSCELVEVPCVKCAAPVSRRLAASHCSNFAVDLEVARDASRIIRKFAELRQHAERLTDAMANTSGAAVVDDEAYAESVEDVKKYSKAVKMQRNQLLQLTEDFYEQVLLKTKKGTILPSGRLATVSLPPPGPFRPASVRGASTLTYRLDYEDFRSYPFQGSEENLAGYGFTIWARWVESGDISFRLKLEPSKWDRCLEWPFSKRINLTVPHLSDRRRDIVLPAGVLVEENVEDPPKKYISVDFPRLSWRMLYTDFLYLAGLYVVVEFV